MRHQDLTRNHIIESWVYANAASRLAGGPFVAADVGRIAYQSDTKQYWRLTATTPTWQPLEPVIVNAQSTPANPTGTANTTGVMMGLGALFTPVKSGSVMVMITGSLTNNTASDGAKGQIRYGTGAAPANGAALTGTAVGNQPRALNNASTAALVTPVAFIAIITGLTLGTQYWFDIGLAAITGGTATLTDVTVDVIEL